MPAHPPLSALIEHLFHANKCSIPNRQLQQWTYYLAQIVESISYRTSAEVEITKALGGGDIGVFH